MSPFARADWADFSYFGSTFWYGTADLPPGALGPSTSV